MKPPQPPIPSEVRELLKDYPEVIQDLQDDLDSLVFEMVGGPNATPPYERAAWLLKDSLGAWETDAYEELEAIKTSGDPQAIERAKEKSLRIGRARGAIGGELYDYFVTHKRAFE
jgi:hypothetical protein